MTQELPKPQINPKALALLGTTSPTAVTANLPVVDTNDPIFFPPQTQLELELLRLFLDKGKVTTESGVINGEKSNLLCLSATMDEQTLALLQKHECDPGNVADALSNITAVIHGVCHNEQDSKTDGFKQVFGQMNSPTELDLVFPVHTNEPPLLEHLKSDAVRPYLERAIRQEFAKTVKLAVQRSIITDGKEGWGHG
jgi:hypothetical protein